jgi:hypothetical protein
MFNKVKLCVTKSSTKPLAALLLIGAGWASFAAVAQATPAQGLITPSGMLEVRCNPGAQPRATETPPPPIDIRLNGRAVAQFGTCQLAQEGAYVPVWVEAGRPPDGALAGMTPSPAAQPGLPAGAATKAVKAANGKTRGDTLGELGSPADAARLVEKSASPAVAERSPAVFNDAYFTDAVLAPATRDAGAGYVFLRLEADNSVGVATWPYALVPRRVHYRDRDQIDIALTIDWARLPPATGQYQGSGLSCVLSLDFSEHRARSLRTVAGQAGAGGQGAAAASGDNNGKPDAGLGNFCERQFASAIELLGK